MLGVLCSEAPVPVQRSAFLLRLVDLKDLLLNFGLTSYYPTPSDPDKIYTRHRLGQYITEIFKLTPLFQIIHLMMTIQLIVRMTILSLLLYP